MATNDEDSVAGNANISDIEDEEEGDDGFAEEPALLLDRDSLARLARDRRRGPPSIASTDLASTVGSVVGPARDACRKSITFYNNDALEWDITFGEITYQKKRWLKKNKTLSKLYVQTISGCFAHSKLHEGDFLATINDKSAPANPDLAVEEMHKALRKDGYLSVSVENPEGADTLLQATVIKPRPNMTYEEMGMVVWYWGYLCIKSISKDSIFYLTVLKDTDHITSINDIETENMTAEGFAHVMSTLDHQVTITVLRRKQRSTGNFS